MRAVVTQVYCFQASIRSGICVYNVCVNGHVLVSFDHTNIWKHLNKAPITLYKYAVYNQNKVVKETKRNAVLAKKKEWLNKEIAKDFKEEM